MATTTAMPTSFKKELLQAVHDFTPSTGDDFKVALIKSSPSGTYGAATTNYSDLTGNSDEVSGTGYTAGGKALTSVTPTTSGTTAYTDFADVSWTSASFTASGAIIYNSSQSNKAVAVLSFGGDKTVSSGTFTIQFPTADSTNAVIRIA